LGGMAFPLDAGEGRGSLQDADDCRLVLLSGGHGDGYAFGRLKDLWSKNSMNERSCVQCNIQGQSLLSG
jgi:hypothetical protein